MKKLLVWFLFLIFAGGSFGQESLKKKGFQIPFPVCYASHDSTCSFVHSPEFNHNHLKSGTIGKASFEITYVGFPFEAQQAFQYAVEIWQNLIQSKVPIRIQANWRSLSSGVLGSCGPADYFSNFNSTQLWNCYYPVALVEKMLGEEVNKPNEFDIIASFNKDFQNWYFGTDGKTPAKQYDFVSTVLHELAHGLGFSGFFYSVNGRAGYGSGDNLPAVFDYYVMNKNAEKLVNTKIFNNPSVKLHTNLTSGWLNFDTRLELSDFPRLFAPVSWDSGSSIYHLDDTLYPTGDPNSLMTPFTGSGEAIHSPGQSALSMLYDMGWKSISIKHKQLKDMELMTAPLSFDAQVESDYELDQNNVYLFYSTNKFLKTDSVLLKPTGIDNQFNARLSQNVNGELRYYFSARDSKKRRYVLPSNAPLRYFSMNIGIDKVAPVISHDPIKYILTTQNTTKIEAIVTDNIGVKSVNVEYFINGGLIKNLPLTLTSGDLFTGQLYFQPGSVKDGDLVSYRIVAIDASSQSNSGRLPLSGYYNFTIEGFKSPVDKFTDNFNSSTRNFISSDFNLSTVSGFDSQALNSAHPYLSPDSDNKEFNFTATLKYPIILKQGGKMSFDEIVLVEPGEAGTKYGDEEFWDYVIVEGSKDNGTTWKPLIDGYDSNVQTSWRTLFFSSMVGQNSRAVPTKDLFVRREIDLLANGNFAAGDVIQIRFRLFSDPYANGWGWIIDNLSIQDIGTSVRPALLSEGELQVFPNPATDRLTIRLDPRNAIRKCEIKLYTASGIRVYTKTVNAFSGKIQSEIDLSGFSTGLYLVIIEPENGQALSRKVQIQSLLN